MIYMTFFRGCFGAWVIWRSSKMSGSNDPLKWGQQRPKLGTLCLKDSLTYYGPKMSKGMGRKTWRSALATSQLKCCGATLWRQLAGSETVPNIPWKNPKFTSGVVLAHLPGEIFKTFFFSIFLPPRASLVSFHWKLLNLRHSELILRSFSRF